MTDLNTKETADKYVEIIMQEWIDAGGDPSLLLVRLARFINEARKMAGLEVNS